MARTSQRLSGKVKAQAGHKRSGSSTTATPNASAKRSKATPTKSEYFKEAFPDEVAEDDVEESPTEDDDDGSDFGEEGNGAEQTSADEDEEENEDDSEDDRKSTPRKSGSAKKKNAEVWRPGVSTGLGPGKQVMIKKPKARPAGSTPYKDHTIHPNTFLFLKELKANNDRPWLKLHDAVFRQAEQDWFSFVDKVTEKLIEIDDTIPELPVKDVIFRIYRDVRFSKDPTPYKPHFSAAWSRTGRKGPYGHYYIHVAPKESFVGGGIWHPEADRIAKMRKDIDRHPERIQQVLMDDGIRKHFLKGAPKNETKVIKAFCTSNQGNALKTKPKGFEADHVNINLLRLRNYTIGCKLSDDEVLGEGGIERICELLTSLKPMITYLNSVVMPDDGPADSSSSEEEEEDEEDSDEEGSDA